MATGSIGVNVNFELEGEPLNLNITGNDTQILSIFGGMYVLKTVTIMFYITMSLQVSRVIPLLIQLEYFSEEVDSFLHPYLTSTVQTSMFTSH